MPNRRTFLQVAAAAAAAVPAGVQLAAAAQKPRPAPTPKPATSVAATAGLPPGVNRTDFDRVLAAWRDTVGNDWVFTSA
ncbi:MAG TPA: twin-arginine translocation signal domain-containing protein, partial [Steroidobacteraceae bacterium]|nr:twin-arginine translocation signal domain-containing protein [Steroidobacteraceae bacterium]